MELRALEPEDAPALHALLARPEVHRELVLSPTEVANLLGPDKWVLGAFEGVELRGACALSAMPRQRTRHIGKLLLLARPDDDDAFNHLVKSAREAVERWWGLHRIDLEVLDARRSALAEQLGFAREVIRRRSFELAGQLIDTLEHAWIRPGMKSTPIPREWPRAPRNHFAFTIRPLSVEDAASFARVGNQPGPLWGTLQLPFTSGATWRARFEKNDASKNKLFAAIVAGELVGNAGLHASPSPKKPHVWSMGMSVADAWQGQGIGRALMEAIISTADSLGVKRLELDVYTDNARAVALYEKLGFEHEGVRRLEAWRDGAYADAFVMSRLR